MVALASTLPGIKELRRGFRDELLELASAVDRTRADTRFRAALDAMALFWNYSLFNQWLIRMQKPTATRVAGRRTWEKLGRSVTDGETPIRIIAPTGGGFPFIQVPVYDLAQTAGAELPTLDVQLAGRTDKLALLEQAASRLGTRVIELRTAAPYCGWSEGGTVRIRPGLPEQERAATLAHELAHEILHQQRGARKRPPRLTEAESEAEAEATAHVVLRALGLPSKAPTYIAWRGGSAAMIIKSMRRIQRAAKEILQAATKPPAPRKRKPKRKK